MTSSQVRTAAAGERAATKQLPTPASSVASTPATSAASTPDSTPTGTPQGTPKPTPQGTPQDTPQGSRRGVASELEACPEASTFDSAATPCEECGMKRERAAHFSNELTVFSDGERSTAYCNNPVLMPRPREPTVKDLCVFM